MTKPRLADVADLVGSARTPEALDSAVQAAEGTPSGEEGLIALALTDRYARIAEAPRKHDPGALLRTKIIRLLDSRGAHDIDLYRQALRTHELMPPTDTEVAAPLRAAALVALAHAGSEVAGYEAILHLSDVDRMTGEPAISAIRVLGALGITQPLYALVLSDTNDDLVGEALRQLTELPPALLSDLFVHLVSDESKTADTVLVGLVDLVLAHREEATFRTRLVDAVAARGSHEVIQYAATAMVAARKAEAFQQLAAHPRIKGDPARSVIVADVRLLW